MARSSSSSDLERVAPNNLDAEMALLGAILINNEAYFRVSDFLEPSHFFEPVHKRIFDLAGGMIRAGKLATPVTLKTYVADVELDGMTAPQYLARLAAEATTIINASDYGRVIFELAQRRGLIGIGEDIVNVAYDAKVDDTPGQQIEEAERKLYAIAETSRHEGGFQAFEAALDAAIQTAAAAYRRDSALSGIATGLADLDQKMGGLQRSDLVIIAGRPGMGKTALATNIAFNIANARSVVDHADGSAETVAGGIVGFFSLEMSAEQLASRVIAEQAGVPSHKIRRGDIEEAEFVKITEVARTMRSLPLHIDQTGGISIAQLTARARRLKRQKGLDVLVVDYLQLLSGSAKKGDNRVQEMTEITTGMKALAKELDVPIIALSQLSRQVESRDDKRPQLSDLRESGSIEQDADVVMFVYREEYYLKSKEPKMGTEEYFKWQTNIEAARNKAEVIIGKQRHGPTGTVPLAFHAEVTRFSNLAQDDRLPERF